jgi:hypothetical protein
VRVCSKEQEEQSWDGDKVSLKGATNICKVVGLGAKNATLKALAVYGCVRLNIMSNWPHECRGRVMMRRVIRKPMDVCNVFHH